MINKKRKIISSDEVDFLGFYNKPLYSDIENPILFIEGNIKIIYQKFTSFNSWKEHLIKMINIVGIEEGEAILIAPLKEILKKYEENKVVRHKFCEECKFGMNYNKFNFPSVPREIIIRSDHPCYAIAFYDEWEKEILLTLYHEVGHLKNIENETDAEKYAIEKVRIIYNHF